jgi:RNA:NAD 2'-phosphotransferase (TPT1/KptA family)
MGALEAVGIVIQLVNMATNMLARATEVSELIKKAHAENRPITKEELDAIVGQDDAARKMLEDAIGRA